MKIFLSATLFLLVTVSVSLAQKSIRDVDFKNFTYEVSCVGEDKRKVTVKDGEFSEIKEVDGYPDRFFYGVSEPNYGDIDGDGAEEAVLISICNTGGTGNFSVGHVFGMKNGKAEEIATIAGGDRAYGGLREIKIENGLIVIKQNDVGERGGACCPEFEVTTKARFTNGKLEEVGQAVRRELYPMQQVNFARGTSKTQIKVTVNEVSRFKLGARAGQTMTVSVDKQYVSVDLYEGEADVKAAEKSFVAKLKQNGEYIIQLQNLGDAPQEVTLTIEIK